MPLPRPFSSVPHPPSCLHTLIPCTNIVDKRSCWSAPHAYEVLQVHMCLSFDATLGKQYEQGEPWLITLNGSFCLLFPPSSQSSGFLQLLVALLCLLQSKSGPSLSLLLLLICHSVLTLQRAHQCSTGQYSAWELCAYLLFMHGRFFKGASVHHLPFQFLLHPVRQAELSSYAVTRQPG